MGSLERAPTNGDLQRQGRAREAAPPLKFLGRRLKHWCWTILNQSNSPDPEHWSHQVLGSLQDNRNSCPLLLGTQNVLVTVETVWLLLTKPFRLLRMPIHPNHGSSWCSPKRCKLTSTQTPVHCSVTPNRRSAGDGDTARPEATVWERQNHRDRTSGFWVQGSKSDGSAEQGGFIEQGCYCVTTLHGITHFIKPAEHTIPRVSSNANCGCGLVITCQCWLTDYNKWATGTQKFGSRQLYAEEAAT